jgi:hypothetical protein
MKALLRAALSLVMISQLSSCQSATGFVNGLFGAGGRMLGAMGRTIGVSDATSVKEPMQMDPHDLEKAAKHLDVSPLPERKVSTLAQSR